jgi:photosystem II stability/assembly factor-like uncharacterized protein
LEPHMVEERMNRPTFLNAVGIVILSLILALVLPATAQVEQFTEQFNDPALPGWEHSTEVSVQDGALHVDPSGYVIHHESWNDFTLEMRLKRSGNGDGLVSYRVANGHAYHVVIGGEFAVLQREAAGSLTELDAIAPHPIPDNEWFQFSVELIGSDHLIRLNDELILEATDPDPLPPGGIAFEAFGELTFEVDDIFLNVEQPPSEAEQQPTRDTTQTDNAQLALNEWTWIRTGGPLGGLGYDVRMHPQDPNLMYVTDAWAGVFISQDGGQSWSPTNQGITARGGSSGDAIPIFSLTIDPNNPDIIWTGTQDVRGIFKSIDGGRTWNEKVNGIVEMSGITFRGFTVDPRSSDIVYAAAEISSWAWANEERLGREFDMTKGVLYKTADGGETWTAIWRGDNLARYIWIDPRHPETIYLSTGIFDREAANSDPGAGLPGGEGVLKSTDGGKTWSSANQGLNNLYVGSLFMHPEQPDILLAGTGNNQYFQNAGVYLTTDGAQSWQYVLEDRVIETVEFSLSDPLIAYAASDVDVYQSQDGGRTWALMAGGEQGWGPPGVRAGFPIDFQVDPSDPNRIFANNYGGGNFLSLDGGRTWEVASTGYTGAQVRGIAVDPTQPERVYAAARSGIFVSQDGGNNWSGLAYPPASGLEWTVVAVDPLRSEHIIASTNWMDFLVGSSDFGRTWDKVGLNLSEGFGFRSLAFAPSNPDIVYAGSAAYYSAGSFNNGMAAKGVFRSDDNGQTWMPANDALSQNAHVAGLAVHPSNPDYVYAATTNLGLLHSQDGGTTWEQLAGGLPQQSNTLSVAIHPQKPEVVYAGMQFGGVYRSIDGGQIWEHVSAGLNPEASVTSIIINPKDASQIFIADQMSGVYVSEDEGTTWRVINEGLRTRAVNAMALSSDGLHLYAATEGEGVFRLDLNGQPPEPLTEMLQTPSPTAEMVLPDTPTAILTQTPEPTEENESRTGGGWPCLGNSLILAVVAVLIVNGRSRKE